MISQRVRRVAVSCTKFAAHIIFQILLEWRALDAVRDKPSGDTEHERVRQASLRIAALADKCQVGCVALVAA